MSKPTDLVQGTLDLLLTPAGRKALKAETAQWERLSSAISLVVTPA